MRSWIGYVHRARIAFRSLLTSALVLGLLGIAGCGWLFPKPEPSLSEEEAEAVLSILNEGARLYKQLVEEGNPDAAELVAEWLRNAPEVAEVFVREDDSIYIIYKCGLPGVILSYAHMAQLPEGLQPFQTSQTRKEQSTWDRCCPLYSYAPSSVTCFNSPQSRKAVIFAFKEEFYQTMAGEKIKKSLESMGYIVEIYIGSEFTEKRLEQLDQYGVIVFLTHGGASPPDDVSRNVWLFTGQRTTWLDLRAIFGKGIGVGKAPDESGVFLIFDQNFIIERNLRFPNSLVLAMACHSFEWESMANTLLNRGAAAYFGWTDTTNENFVYNFLDIFFAHGNPWPYGWSVSKVMSYQFEWPLPGNPKASLQEVFCNADLPPKTVSCRVCKPNGRCKDELVQISLPALGYVLGEVPPNCSERREATPVLKWKSTMDLVLNPSDGPGCKGLIEISFTPMIVPFEISPTGGPGWFYTVTISEKNGIGVKLERLEFERYDSKGRLLGQWDWDERVFRRLFKTDKLDPKSSISAKISEWPGAHSTPAILVWKVFGTDSNGNHLEASNTVEFQQNAERGLKVEIGPPTLVEGNWQYEVSISEIKGSETKLMGFSVATFDELEWSIAQYVGTSDDIAKIFGTNTIPSNGQIRALVAQLYNPADRALAWVVAGVDEKGTLVYGSGAAELVVASSGTSEKVWHHDAEIIVPLVHLVEETQ